MEIYVMMHLSELVDNLYYTSEEEVIKEVERANEEFGGDFWYKPLYESESTQQEEEL